MWNVLSRRLGEIGAAGAAGAGKLLGIRVLNYLTNYVINHIPSYTLRPFWYRRATKAVVLTALMEEGIELLAVRLKRTEPPRACLY